MTPHLNLPLMSVWVRFEARFMSTPRNDLITPRAGLAGLIGLAALTVGGCVSPRFEKAWKEAGDGPTGGGVSTVARSAASSGSVASGAGSRWVGRWESTRHGAGGRLRAVLTGPTLEPGASQGTLDAFFEAQWHGFTTAYPTRLKAELVLGKNGLQTSQSKADGRQTSTAGPAASGQGYVISGTHDLKSWVGGGVYTYAGTLSGGGFEARYESKYDAGVFRLKPFVAPQRGNQ